MKTLPGKYHKLLNSIKKLLNERQVTQVSQLIGELEAAQSNVKYLKKELGRARKELKIAQRKTILNNSKIISLASNDTEDKEDAERDIKSNVESELDSLQDFVEDVSVKDVKISECNGDNVDPADHDKSQSNNFEDKQSKVIACSRSKGIITRSKTRNIDVTPETGVANGDAIPVEIADSTQQTKETAELMKITDENMDDDDDDNDDALVDDASDRNPSNIDEESEVEDGEMSGDTEVRGKRRNRISRYLICECGVCGRKFSSLTTLSKHSLIHAGGKPFACDRCDRSYATERLLNKHVPYHEMKETAEAEFVCADCCRTFKRRASYDKHVKNHEVDSNLSYCDECGKVCANSGNLRLHKERAHGSAFKCQECDRSYGCKKMLDEHVKTQHETAEGDELKCPACDESFRSKKDVSSHLQAEHFEKRDSSYVCKSCGRRFATERVLRKHAVDGACGKMNAAAARQDYICEECGKRFPSISAIKRHRACHLTENPYRCGFCDKTFARKEGLVIHERTHTGEKPYQCRWCPKYFPNPSTRCSHEYVHKSHRPFQCDICEWAFPSKKRLQVHRRRHTDEYEYQCSYCHKRFSSRSSLASHERIHTGDRRYGCEVCGQRFLHKHHLKNHMRIHTGLKPFPCTVCDERFAYVSSQVNHMRQIHGVVKKPRKGRDYIPPQIADSSNAPEVSVTSADAPDISSLAVLTNVDDTLSVIMTNRNVQTAIPLYYRRGDAADTAIIDGTSSIVSETTNSTSMDVKSSDHHYHTPSTGVRDQGSTASTGPLIGEGPYGTKEENGLINSQNWTDLLAQCQ